MTLSPSAGLLVGIRLRRRDRALPPHLVLRCPSRRPSPRAVPPLPPPRRDRAQRRHEWQRDGRLAVWHAHDPRVDSGRPARDPLALAGCGSSSNGGGSNPQVASCSSTPVFSCTLRQKDTDTCREVFSNEAAEELRAQCTGSGGEMRDAGCGAKLDVCCQDNGAPGGYPQRTCLFSIQESVAENFRASCAGEICE